MYLYEESLDVKDHTMMFPGPSGGRNEAQAVSGLDEDLVKTDGRVPSPADVQWDGVTCDA